jgi:hypothetical protein
MVGGRLAPVIIQSWSIPVNREIFLTFHLHPVGAAR